MRFLFLVFMLAAVVCEAAPREQFPISFWCAPGEKFTTLERYQEIKDAGFTLAMPPCSGTTIELNKKILTYCQATGLKAFIADSRLLDPSKAASAIADYSKSPALAGYSIADEPEGNSFPGLGSVVKYLHDHDPAHPGYINLYPNYAPAWTFRAPSYKQYVRNFVSTVHPFVISYDHYNFTNHGDGPQFFSNLSDVRDVSLETKTPFWQIVLVVECCGFRDLNEGELRYEAMQTLAYGGKGLMWFTYWSPAESDKSTTWKHAMIDTDGTRDPHYDMVKKINHDVQAIGSQLLHATSVAVYQTGQLPPGGTAAPKDAAITFVSGNPSATVGVFKSGRFNYALIASTDYKNPQQAAIPVGKSAKELFDPATGEWSKLPSPESMMNVLDLPAGGAVLLRW